MRHTTQILKRHPKNPLIHTKDYPHLAQIYNPSPVIYDGKTILLVSVVEHTATRGIGRDVGQTRVAVSDDGVRFTLSEEDFIGVQSDEYPWTLYHHFIDNRVTKIDDTYYIITPVMVAGYASPVGMLGRTKDFKTYERIAIITQPQNRGASLFPEKINGKYYKLDRPGAGEGGFGEIWISASENLIHWGEFQPILAPNYRFWNSQKIGPTPPIKTERGWLVIIHGVFIPAGNATYYIGAILLDLDEPWRIIGKTNSYLLAPETEYEHHGNCNNVVFACGAIPDYENDILKLYYGACDSCVCLAEGCLSAIVDACVNNL